MATCELCGENAATICPVCAHTQEMLGVISGAKAEASKQPSPTLASLLTPSEAEDAERVLTEHFGYDYPRKLCEALRERAKEGE